jgi:short-subunit dehydrogenase
VLGWFVTSNAMADELANRVALITGASRGIGRATALRLARAGCDVALVAKSAAQLEAVALEAAEHGVRTLVLPADITDDAQVEALVQRALVQLGNVSILVNSAGVASPRRTHTKASVAAWDRMLATCLRAPMVLSHLLLPDMLAHHEGAIINIASTAAREVRPGEAVYAAAKAGLLAFTRALFAEVRNDGVKIVALCPGYVDTTFIPPNRRVDRSKFLRPEDVADAVHQVVITPPHACPTEIVLQPQFDPEAR